MAAGGASSPGGQGDVCTAVGCCYAGREVDVCHLAWVFVPEASWCPEDFFGNSEFSSFRCSLVEEMCFTKHTLTEPPVCIPLVHCPSPGRCCNGNLLLLSGEGFLMLCHLRTHPMQVGRTGIGRAEPGAECWLVMGSHQVTR